MVSGGPPMDVSRETAERVFGAALGGAESFAQLLATDGVVRGVIGPRETDRLWSRHLVNSAAVVTLFATAGDIVDIGSGAGLPGIVIALLRPEQRVRLVEPLARRTDFLTIAVARLGLSNVDVVRGRAEEQHGRWTAPTVTARAVAPLERLAGWCLPLVNPGGVLLAIKGRQASTELSAAEPALAAMGASSWSVLEQHVPGLEDPVRVVRITRSDVPWRQPR